MHGSSYNGLHGGFTTITKKWSSSFTVHFRQNPQTRWIIQIWLLIDRNSHNAARWMLLTQSNLFEHKHLIFKHCHAALYLQQHRIYITELFLKQVCVFKIYVNLEHNDWLTDGWLVQLLTSAMGDWWMEDSVYGHWAFIFPITDWLSFFFFFFKIQMQK